MTIREARQILNPLRERCFDGDLAELYKLRDVAFLTGVSMSTIRRRIRAGTLTAWGKPLRVRPRDLLMRYEPPPVGPGPIEGESQ